MPLVGLNNNQRIIYMPKRMVYIYAAYEKKNQFAIVYMINHSRHINKVFREQVEICLRSTFYENTIENIRYVMKNKDTCVITLFVLMRVKGKPISVYRVLSCDLYSIIEVFVCIYNLSCQSKNFSSIFSNKIF